MHAEHGIAPAKQRVADFVRVTQLSWINSTPGCNLYDIAPIRGAVLGNRGTSQNLSVIEVAPTVRHVIADTLHYDARRG